VTLSHHQGEAKGGEVSHQEKEMGDSLVGRNTAKHGTLKPRLGVTPNEAGKREKLQQHQGYQEQRCEQGQRVPEEAVGTRMEQEKQSEAKEKKLDG